jgi:hypothetical protein
MVPLLRLALCHLLLRLVASGDSLLVSPGSPASYPGFHQPLALVLAKHNTRDKESKAQKNSAISINQSNVLSTHSEQQDACNNFMI